MWQRVQTLYFGIIVALMAALLSGNFATVPGTEDTMRYTEYLPYAVLIVISLAANLVALFCWGRRSLQIRLAGGAAVVLLALQVWIAVGYFKLPDAYVVRWTAVLPLAALIFEILAMRGVYADEMLVRSASRLRSAKRKQNR